MTGSNFLLESGETKFLVDCGLFQSQHACEETNWSTFPYDPKTIQYLIVTHAHIDHIGRIPRLIKEGFKGKIISTEATKALAEPLLLDAIELLEREAHRCNREPLYGKEDIARALSLWEGISYHQKKDLRDGFELEFLDSGHILGSAMAWIKRGEKSIVFTGDLGGGNSPLLASCEDLPRVDYVVMESVYGDRLQPEKEHRREALEDIIEDTAARKGTLLIPAFSNERTQDLLYEIRNLMTEKRVPLQPVILDSPLAEKITQAFLKFPPYFSSEVRARVEKGENIFAFPQLQFASTVEDSRKADHIPSPKIIIAGSGMSNGGRVREHEMHVLPDANSTLLIVGFQVAGSLGRQLLEGLKKVTFDGNHIPVKCRVEAIYSYSAHMDGEELLEFVNKGAKSLQAVFVVMGEPSAAGTLVQRIRDFLGVRATAPELGEQATIEL